MISNFTVLTVPQWAIFVSITVSVYGWVEHKKVFCLLGSAILALLGVFALWAIQAGLLVPETFFDTGHILDGEELFSLDEIPLEGRMLPFYWAIALNSLFALAAFITEMKGKRSARIFTVITLTIATIIFFGMVSTARF